MMTLNPLRTLIASVSLVALAAIPATAEAQDAGPRGLGLGVEMPLAGALDAAASTPAVELVYDTGAFHFDILASYVDFENQASVLGLGGRFYYHLHHGSAADFSIGGGLGVQHIAEPGDDGENFNDILLEVGPKIRLFLSPSVALHTTFGLAVVLGDSTDDEFGLVGRLGSQFGLTYFFH